MKFNTMNAVLLLLWSTTMQIAVGNLSGSSTDCPYRSNDFDYSMEIRVKTSSSCSSDDLALIRTTIEEALNATFSSLPEVEDSNNMVCGEPVPFARNRLLRRRQVTAEKQENYNDQEQSPQQQAQNMEEEERMLQGYGGGFVYNGGGWCQWCNGDNSDGRRRLTSVFGGVLTNDVDSSPTPAPTPSPTPSPTSAPVSAAFQDFTDVVVPQTETKVSTELSKAFHGNPSHCLYGMTPSIEVTFYESTTPVTRCD